MISKTPIQAKSAVSNSALAPNNCETGSKCETGKIFTTPSETPSQTRWHVFATCIPTADANRARWPAHGLWQQFEGVIKADLLKNSAGVLPSDMIHANRTAKMRELDALLSGLFITRAPISDVSVDGFDEFMENHVEALMRLVSEHSVSVEERIAKARGRYRLD